MRWVSCIATLGVVAVGCGSRSALDGAPPSFDAGAGGAEAPDGGTVYAFTKPTVDDEAGWHCGGEIFFISNAGGPCAWPSLGIVQEHCTSWAVSLHVPEIGLHPGPLTIDNDATFDNDATTDCSSSHLSVRWLVEWEWPNYPKYPPTEHFCWNPGGLADGDVTIFEVTPTEIVFSLAKLAPWDDQSAIWQAAGETFPWAQANGTYTAERCPDYGAGG